MKVVQMLFAILIVGLLVLAGCAKNTDTASKALGNTEENLEASPANAASGEVDEMSSEISEVESIDSEFDTTELDSLDADLESLDW